MVRMWMCDPRILCRQHLLGEHNELHLLVGSIKKGRSVSGYIQNNCIELLSLVSRHKDLVKEMEKRNYIHRSPLTIIREELYYLPWDEIIYQINRSRSLVDLLTRCPHCRDRFRKMMKNEVD
jgi:hypothetical protein